ncbi:E3 ubiquitin-protein ligase herc2 [Saguinus oedipus]|uniref:E3 ubiquitin-protein ligase herc2 n=1 Tax=Saguinus oedipus TaxID=9490 RepID=A0ABQ9VEY6_SAGOE|nr:E3 ubiquitin-protein ligase herc2 [Saguinus oedipus]
MKSSLPLWSHPSASQASRVCRALFLGIKCGFVRMKSLMSTVTQTAVVLSLGSLHFSAQVLDKYSPPDHFLPESYTCFFLLKLPRYSCRQVLEEKLKYAIHFCKSIDTDDYARIALTGEPAADGSSDDSDNEDVDSFASDSTQDYLTGH